MIFRKSGLIAFIMQTSVFMLHCKTVDMRRHSQQKNNDTLWQMESDERLNVSPTWSVSFDDEYFNMTMTQTRLVKLTINFNNDGEWGREFEFHVLAQDKELLRLSHNVITAADIKAGQTTWSGNVTVEALFLGHSKIFAELRRPDVAIEISVQTSEVIILRNIGQLDLLFNVCVGIFVILLNINFGAVLQLDALKAILIKPIGPAIGFIGQFIVMPIVGFSIGYFLFRDMIELRLGIFFTGCTPGGGVSNIFTVILNGNINLSITMTSLSNLAAFGMMPLWIFTLGTLIFNDGNLMVPYKTIALVSCSLMVPLCIGIALQKFAPRVAKKMEKFLKPVSLFFVLFITVFAFTVNSYIFKLFSWKIIFASSALPWIGYIIGFTLAIICRQSRTDALTIAIETGIQNTGIAIFMLNFSLPQPQADMTSAIPVANSMMTPLPLLLILVLKKIFRRPSVNETEGAEIKMGMFTEAKAILEKEQTDQTKAENKT